jgi:hypothetical protein
LKKAMSVSCSAGVGIDEGVEDVEGDVVGVGDVVDAVIEVVTGARLCDVEDVDDPPEQPLRTSEPAKAPVMSFNQPGPIVTSRPPWPLR